MSATAYLMIETQEGVTWPEWLALAERAEAAGLDGLVVSDHYLSMVDESRPVLDAWGALAAIAARTTRLRLGTLVSPVTFRHPSVLARLALTVDQISGGRASVGLGAGWFEREHAALGFPFPGMSERLTLLEEQAMIVHALLNGETLFYDSPAYRLEDVCLCSPPAAGRIPLVLGGAARPRTARLAARAADEYNLVFVEPEFCVGARARLDQACNDAGRDPATLPMTLMARLVVGRDEAEVRDRLARVREREGGGEPDPTERPTWLVGTPDQVLTRIAEYRAAGVTGYRFQHLDHTDLDMIDLIGSEIAPHLGG